MDLSAQLRERVQAAFAASQPLAVSGGGSKAFYGRQIMGEPLHIGEHRGITAYDPAELVLTARSGTPLAEIEQTLAQSGQCLPFEPPYFGDTATLGGTIACGIAGPARPYAGAVKDFVLGVSLLSGDGKVMRFGGQVMKNVAGYDIARTMVGAMGTLGILLDVSTKVLPRASHQLTLALDIDAAPALARMQAWARQASCLSASCWLDRRLLIRLSGSEAATCSARERFGGEHMAEAEQFWHAIREQTHPYFRDSAELIRVVVPAHTAPLEFEGEWLMEWGGTQRWLTVRADAAPLDLARLREVVGAVGGFATYFRGGNRGAQTFPPLPAATMRLQHSLRAVFDPRGILNRGRMYPWS